MMDYRWLSPSEVDLFLRDRRPQGIGPRWRRPEDKPSSMPPRPRRKR